MKPVRVLVLGGSGNFGARIVRALQGDPTVELLAASRRGTPVPGMHGVRLVVLDMEAPEFRPRLTALNPGLVIHCVGPFQGQDYRVVQAALASGAHYLDLADGRDFVACFSAANDAAARAADRIALSGASTLPALSSAVIDALCGPLRMVDRIELAIAPGQRAPRGVATLAAVFSYLGRPIPVWRNGQWKRVWGWMDLRRLRLDIGNRWAAACDVPDLALLPERYSGVSDVEFHAALEFGIQHFALYSLAALRRVGLPLPVERMASGLNHMAKFFDRWGGPSGGMRVSIEGRRTDGMSLRRTWQLSAPALNGPEVPCMAAILLARRIARGALAVRGAHACMTYLTLDDFEPEFARWDIRTRIEDVAL
jgi:saccharopine dehydrogenase-like NADP-dependent oxidoreductase